MKLTLFLCSVLAAFSMATVVAQEKPKAAANLADELGYKGFNTLKTAVINAGLAEMLSGTEPYTLLAPTDNAFRDLPKAQLDALLADKAKLKQVIESHIVAGKVPSSELKNGPVKTLAGTTLQGKTVDGKIKVEAATVVKPDVNASNGVIHGIDKLLTP
jgi:uncharacterized surface protein with fasciclin (FAS1) repeats